MNTKFILVSLKFYYYFATLNGLIPFDYFKFKKQGKHSFSLYWFALCVALTLLSCLFFTFTKSIIIYTTQYYNKRIVLVIVYYSPYYIKLLRVMILYLFQLIYRKDYIKFIDQIRAIFTKVSHISLTNSISSTSFVTEQIGKYIFFAVSTVIFNVVFLIVSINTCVNGTATIVETVSSCLFESLSAGLYVHISFLSSMFILMCFVTLLLFASFFRVLNRKLMEIIESVEAINEKGCIKIEQYCKLSDECDIVTEIFTTMTDVLMAVMNFFLINVILVFADSFVVILNQVRTVHIL